MPVAPLDAAALANQISIYASGVKSRGVVCIVEERERKRERDKPGEGKKIRNVPRTGAKEGQKDRVTTTAGKGYAGRGRQSNVGRSIYRPPIDYWDEIIAWG